MKLLLVAGLCLSAPGLAAQQAGRPEPGKPAPPLVVEKWLEPAGELLAGWEALHGKIVVLEFWATWCGPCVAAIPHLNELAKKFQGRIEFISLTDEPEAPVKKFLASRPIEGWVALDTDRSVFQAYGVEWIPHTALVDPYGNLVTTTMPEYVTEAVLEDLLAGKVEAVRAKLPRESPRVDASIRAAEGAPPALFEVLIRPAKPGRMAMRMSSHELAAQGMTLKSALAIAYGISQIRMVVPDWIADTIYDVIVTVPTEQAAWRDRVFQRALETTFNLEVRRETRELSVLLLMALRGQSTGLRGPFPASGMMRAGKGAIKATGSSLASLARSLESDLKRPVLDETGLAGNYDFELQWDLGNPESLLAAVREQLGLELGPARRPVELLIVEPAASPKP